MKTLYKIGDVVNVKFQYVGGEFNGTARVVDEIYGVEWSETRKMLVKSSKLTKVTPPAFEILSVIPSNNPSNDLSVGDRIWGSWGDIIGVEAA